MVLLNLIFILEIGLKKIMLPCAHLVPQTFNSLHNFFQKWSHWKREAANLGNWLVPWERRIKEIESHFGSVVASYFTFLRWLFWVNIVIATVLTVFVVVPEVRQATKPIRYKYN